MPATREFGEQHGVAGADGDAVHQQPGTGLGQGPVQEVDRTGGRPAGGDHHIGGGVPDGVPEQAEVVPDGARFAHLGAGRAQPGRQQRAERVPDQAGPRDPGAEQFVAEDEEFDDRAAADRQQVVAAGRGEAQHGRADRGAGGQQRLTATALLAARADVLAGGQRARGAVVQQGADPLAVLATQDGGGTGREPGTGGDLGGRTVGQRRHGRLPGQYPPGDPPGARPGDGPAVHRRGVEGGQVGEGGERLGEGPAERIGQVQALRRERVQPGPVGRRPGLRPRQGPGGGASAGHGGLLDGAHGCSAPAAAVQRSASSAARRDASATASGPPPRCAAA